MAHTIYGQSTIIISKGSDVQNPYVATTLDEFKSYLTSENVGAFVKYAPQSGTPSPVNPIAVGDTISKLYFDTTKEVDFSKFIYDQPFADDIPTGVAMLLSSQQNVNILTANDLSVAGMSGFVLMLMEKTSQTSADVKQTILYASEALPDLGVSQAGWQKDSSLNLLQENIISTVNAQDIWGAYISKDGQWTSSSESSEYRPGIYQVISENNAVLYQVLPALTNEGTAEDLAKGKQLINSNGEVVEGTAGGETTGAYTVKVIDYDGTVLLEEKGNAGDVIELPTAPTHDRLVFQEWSASVAVSDNKVTITDNDIMVGAVYTTTSGKNEFDITLTKVTGLSVTLNMNGTKDWGDGTSDTETIHTYTLYGDYTILCDGTAMTTSDSSGLFGQSNVLNYYCTFARIATKINIGKFAFHNCYSLKNVTISNDALNIGEYVFKACRVLMTIVVPTSVTSIGIGAFALCSSLTQVIIPNNVTEINISTFATCLCLTSVILPNSVTSIGKYAFSSCYSLKNIIIPNSVTNIGSQVFIDCAVLTNIVVPNNVTKINAAMFVRCYALMRCDFSQHTAVPTLANTDAFSTINAICRIIVPDSLYNKWIAASNWSTYADYIYKASEVTE